MIQAREVETGRAAQVLALLKQSRLYWNIRKEVIQQILRTRKDQHPPTVEEVLKAMSQLGFQEQIRSAAMNCANRTAKRVPLQKDNMPEVQQVKLRWCQNLIRAFRTVTNKLRKDEQDEEEDESVNYVYDASTLLQFLTTIKIKQPLRIRQLECFMFPVQIVRVPKYAEIKMRFDFMTSPENIVGRDRQTPSYRDREKKAIKLLESELMESEIERYMLYGCTNGQRVQLYSKYFQLEEDQRLVSSLLQQIEKKNNPFDNIVTADVTDILNDERYFVFKEEIRRLIKMFVRDRSIQQKAKIHPHLFTGLEVEVAKEQIPLSQILPCKNLSRYIAPFCYTSLKLQAIYALFRQFYCGYFCLLHSISSEPSSILCTQKDNSDLSLQFEELMDNTQKKLCTHFNNLGLQPLRLVFPWLFYCFIGYVDIQQVFYLLDRIVGMKSLEILPVYAVALLSKERQAIMEARTAAEVEEIVQQAPKTDYVAETIRHFLVYHL